MFANGTIPQGREYEGVRNLATGFARAGYLVVVPDLPGLRTDAITPNTVSETVEVALEVSERTDAKNGRVGLVGVSTGATLALLAAESPVLRGRVSAVAGIAPYTDIRTVLAIATTGHYKLDGRMVPYRAEPFLSYVIARSLVSALPPGEDRRTLLRELDAVERSSPTPLADLRERSARDLGPEARSVLALLANRDPERFATLYRDLPPNIKSSMKRLSPVDGAERLEAPVELVTGPQDKYFPPRSPTSCGAWPPDAS
ncbi:Alpha/beta hydrolase family (plasmid) [Rubrobacter radiotolerans]|uniref:Alpha/beta hydrolase family n=1 Tax=Rubrobacter radiotolerans TaxID=42256 RepID=A0A023X703_RUBRA|nr:Alpha/beta hydrolase family [Rubrobacter radiotolerans]